MKRVDVAMLVMLLGAADIRAQMTLKNMGLDVEAARHCAEQGDADCQAKLGWFYENGANGVGEDHVQAVKWYRMAAEQGLVEAQMALATTFEGGYHIPQDYAESAKWYLRAAERGGVDAQRKIAFFYWIGKGVPQDLVRAHMWASLTVAGEQSRWKDKINEINAGPGSAKEKEGVIQILHDSFQQSLDSAVRLTISMEAEMTQAQIVEAQRLAREWKRNEVSTSKDPVK